MEKSESFVSVVTMTKNDCKTIKGFLRKMQVFLENNFVDYEVVIIDQRSIDGTQKAIESLLTEVPGIRLIELANPVNHDVAMAAGLENAIGDFVVLFSHLKDPIDCIVPIVEQCKIGDDIVVGAAKQGVSFPYRIIRPFVQKLLPSIGFNLPKNSTNLRCLSRRAVNSVTRAGRFHHQFYVRIQKTGYPCSTFIYDLLKSSPKKTLFSGINEALRFLVFNSTKPLRWMSGFGIGASTLVLTSGIFSFIWILFSGETVPLILYFINFISLVSMLHFGVLAFFGEYLGRLLDDVGEQYLYSVVNEKNSSVMLNTARVNVLSDSLSSESSME